MALYGFKGGLKEGVHRSFRLFVPPWGGGHWSTEQMRNRHVYTYAYTHTFTHTRMTYRFAAIVAPALVRLYQQQ